MLKKSRTIPIGIAMAGKLLFLFGLFVVCLVTPSFAQVQWSSQSPAGINDDIWCVTYAADTFAAVTSQGNLLTSADGLTWNSQTISAGTLLISIAYGSGKWVAVGASGTVLVSSDLKTWVAAKAVTSNQLNGVLYNGTVWLAVGNSTTVITSPDALNWTVQTVPAGYGITGYLHGITLVQDYSTLSNPVPVTAFLISGAQAGNGTGSIDNGVLLILSSSGTQFSTDALPFPTPGNLEAVLNSNGSAVAVGWGGSIAYNNNPVSYSYAGVYSSAVPYWNNSPSANPNVILRGLTHGNGYWVAAGANGTILNSTDGINWLQANSGTSSSTLLSAAYSPALSRLVVTGTGGTILVSNAPPPSITAQPVSQSVDLGGSVTFSVTASGAPTLTYQWFKNGTAITGATSSSLSLTNVQDSDAGSYTVVVANSVNVATSEPVALTVLNIPVITGLPASATGSIGLPFSLALTIGESPSSVSVSGMPPGLVFNSSANIISGSPTTTGVYTISVSASNAFGAATPAECILTIGATPLVFSVLAGGKAGSMDGTGAAAQFDTPNGLAIDTQGNLYVADTGNFTIRKVSASGVVTTIAGSAGIKGSSDGRGASALFSSPTGIAVDATGNLYVTDTGNNTIRKIDTTGQSSTIAGTPGVTGAVDNSGSAASFNGPTGIAVDSSGNLYVADCGNDTVRKISSAAAVTTLAGLAGQSGDIDAFGIGARFNDPTGVALDATGNIYVNDDGNTALRQITPTGSTSTLASLPGGIHALGTNSSSFNGVAVDASGNVYVNVGPFDISTGDIGGKETSDLLLVGSSGSTSILQQWIDVNPGVGAGTSTSLTGLARDGAGNLYILVNGVLEKSSSASGPTITSQPQNQSAVAGQSATFSVTANGNPAPAYQWQFNGTAISGATGSTFTLSDVSPAQAGSYSVTVYTPYTSVTSNVANLAVSGVAARLINISTRAQVGTGGNILIPGFVISGSGTETLLIRGDGPSLTQLGVAGALAQPVLSVLNGQTVIATNTGWGTNPNPTLIASTAASVGAFAFTQGSADSALIVSLPAGTYTVEVSGANNTTGVALAEIYEVSTTGTRLTNISTRAQVGTGGNIMIAGFVISGGGSEQLLIRGDGPSLTQYGVTNVLAEPTLSVVSGQTTIATNTGWGTNSNPSQITSVGSSVGAFSFASGSADSALYENLPAGAYTAEISGVNSSTGVALVEIYEVQ